MAKTHQPRAYRLFGRATETTHCRGVRLRRGYLGVEEDRVWFGEFGEGDGVCRVVGICVRPHVRIRGCIGVVSGISRRVRPVVWFRRDGGGEWEVRTGVCAG